MAGKMADRESRSVQGHFGQDGGEQERSDPEDGTPALRQGFLDVLATLEPDLGVPSVGRMKPQGLQLSQWPIRQIGQGGGIDRNRQPPLPYQGSNLLAKPGDPGTPKPRQGAPGQGPAALWRAPGDQKTERQQDDRLQVVPAEARERGPLRSASFWLTGEHPGLVLKEFFCGHREKPATRASGARRCRSDSAEAS